VKKPPTKQEEETHCWTRRYEQLRQGIISGLYPGGGLSATDCGGLSLVIRQGLIAWMRAWQEPLGYPAVAVQTEILPIITPTESWQQEATRLLVNMALGNLKL
jgi:hypothetical protein